MAAQSSPLETDNRDAASLYFGKVMHARLKPIKHRFEYRVMSALIDLDRLTEADQQTRLFKINRAGLYSFHERDHGPRDGSSLAAYARSTARSRGVDLDGGKVLLLCYPRLFGYAFNPLSVFYGFDATGRLAMMIYEVRNTFGEMHTYVLPVKNPCAGAACIRQSQDKAFYVSPFIEMSMRYHFRVTPPGAGLTLRILETDAEGPLLAATFSAQRRPLNGLNLLRSFVLLPLVTMKIVAAIHWQALRLWLKGARLVPKAEHAGPPRFQEQLVRDHHSA